MKLNKIIFIVLIAIMALSSKCDDTGTTYEISYEPENTQYAKEIDSIETYLQSHFVNDLGDLDPATYSFDEIPDGGTQTSLWNDSRLAFTTTTADADHDDIDQTYKLYYMKFREGVGQRPTYVDSIYTTYKGIVLSGTNANQEFDHKTSPIWLSLPGLIRAWDRVLPQIKAGTYTTNGDGTISYDDFGVMAFFVPSGLGYYNNIAGELTSYTPAIFHVSLRAVVTDVDHDHDGILTIYEDLNGNEDVRDDNTDSDSEPSTNPFPNYNDADDDNDGHNTIDEGSDPNEDGNPDDAEDLDNDGIPNYLDSDSY